jgi:hypothetical protein
MATLQEVVESDGATGTSTTTTRDAEPLPATENPAALAAVAETAVVSSESTKKPRSASWRSPYEKNTPSAEDGEVLFEDLAAFLLEVSHYQDLSEERKTTIATMFSRLDILLPSKPNEFVPRIQPNQAHLAFSTFEITIVSFSGSASLILLSVAI